MRRLLLALALVAVAPEPAPATELPDWVTARTTIAHGGTFGVHGWLSGTARLVGGDSPMIAAAYGDGEYPAVFVDTYDGGAARVRATRGAGEFELEVLPADEGRLEILTGVRTGGPFDAGQEVAWAVFVSGMVLESFEFHVEIDGRPAAYDLDIGTGTAVIDAAAPQDLGFGAMAGPAAVALTSTHTARPAAGIVGGFRGFGCVACFGTWSAPDDGGGTWFCWGVLACSTSSGSMAGEIEDRSFAGPPGRWSWSWSGAHVGERRQSLVVTSMPVPRRSGALGLYAPVGAPWALFRRLDR